MRDIAVLIVDDSTSARHLLAGLLQDAPGIQVSGQAADAFDAVGLMRAALPDVMILDLQLPRMDGLTFLKKIMLQHPLPVIVCSSFTEANSQLAFRALELGACEVIAKPRLTGAAARAEARIQIVDAVRAAAQIGRTTTGRDRPPAKTVSAPSITRKHVTDPKLTADAILAAPRAGGTRSGPRSSVIAIGASTGGTEALSRLLPALRTDLPPILIVQHMPEKFTAAFARRLDGFSAVIVREAVDCERLEGGTVLIAPGNHHMILHRHGGGYRVEIRGGPYVARHRPSVDVLFRSVAIAAECNALGVLMTGMGDDGARGLQEMAQAGADTLVQDEASSVVWGMPGEAFRLGAARRQVPLGKIADDINAFASASGARVRS